MTSEPSPMDAMTAVKVLETLAESHRQMRVRLGMSDIGHGELFADVATVLRNLHEGNVKAAVAFLRAEEDHRESVKLLARRALTIDAARRMLERSSNDIAMAIEEMASGLPCDGCGSVIPEDEGCFCRYPAAGGCALLCNRCQASKAEVMMGGEDGGPGATAVHGDRGRPEEAERDQPDHGGERGGGRSRGGRKRR